MWGGEGIDSVRVQGSFKHPANYILRVYNSSHWFYSSEHDWQALSASGAMPSSGGSRRLWAPKVLTVPGAAALSVCGSRSLCSSSGSNGRSKSRCRRGRFQGEHGSGALPRFFVLLVVVAVLNHRPFCVPQPLLLKTVPYFKPPLFDIPNVVSVFLIKPLLI